MNNSETTWQQWLFNVANSSPVFLCWQRDVRLVARERGRATSQRKDEQGTQARETDIRLINQARRNIWFEVVIRESMRVACDTLHLHDLPSLPIISKWPEKYQIIIPGHFRNMRMQEPDDLRNKAWLSRFYNRPKGNDLDISYAGTKSERLYQTWSPTCFEHDLNPKAGIWTFHRFPDFRWPTKQILTVKMLFPWSEYIDLDTPGIILKLSYCGYGWQGTPICRNKSKQHLSSMDIYQTWSSTCFEHDR